MSLIVIDPGLFSTIQDQGRPGYRAFGVPPGGAFDAGSADLANALVNNPEGSPVLEMTLRGGTYEALHALPMALAGAPLSASIEGGEGRSRRLVIPGSFTLRAGERLVLGLAERGLRTYLAVRGGWRTKSWLGSQSTETPLQAGQAILGEPGEIASRHPEEGPTAPPRVRLVMGPDADRLRTDIDPFTLSYRVGSRSNRVGLRLEGPTCQVESDPNRVSTPVAPGAIQVAGGQLLILGVACGTMGGYPQIAQIISADLDHLGQLRPGESVRFDRVSIAEARRLSRERREWLRLRRLRVAAASAD